ncbi:unnamed protein product [Cylicocyclus nassatus]|uniref:Uncharacterized protein n=1 Tax=Cylicocyclus nassatus TaxID=53992 RepID=A0AA36H4Y2_CYLNA|nr:unnamed protein product [Cylicocyclus nassatus]
MDLAETSLDIALIVVCIIVLSSFILCSAVLLIMFRGRRSSRFKVFFYRSWWNEGFINIFILIFFSATMYTRCFTSMVSTFIQLNRFPWWTKFAQITQEHLMYIQCMNVFLTVAGRFCTICLPRSRLTATTERMKSWTILILQISLPTIVVIPLYFLYDFQYGLKGITNPLLLSTIDASYDQVGQFIS